MNNKRMLDLIEITPKEFSSELKLYQYSDKSYVFTCPREFGETNSIHFKEGITPRGKKYSVKFNNKLKDRAGQNFAGWVISATHPEVIQAFADKIVSLGNEISFDREVSALLEKFIVNNDKLRKFSRPLRLSGFPIDLEVIYTTLSDLQNTIDEFRIIKSNFEVNVIFKVEFDNKVIVVVQLKPKQISFVARPTVSLNLPEPTQLSIPAPILKHPSPSLAPAPVLKHPSPPKLTSLVPAPVLKHPSPPKLTSLVPAPILKHPSPPKLTSLVPAPVLKHPSPPKHIETPFPRSLSIQIPPQPAIHNYVSPRRVSPSPFEDLNSQLPKSPTRFNGFDPNFIKLPF